MDESSLQDLCARGQTALALTDYHAAERHLVRAEQLALKLGDFDTLSRLYMPLQESRRQRRQRSGEGVVRFDLVDPPMSAEQIVGQYPHGQLLVAGRASIDLALAVRELAWKHELFLDVFLGAMYPVGDGAVIAIVPDGRVAMPQHNEQSLDRLLARLPPHAVVRSRRDLPDGARTGSDQTYARTMALFEELHRPALARALGCTDPLQRILQLREVIEIDYACEIAHQAISKTARQLAGR
jgi:hypothetical protein